MTYCSLILEHSKENVTLCSDILHGVFSESIQGEKFPGNFSISRNSALIVKMFPGIPSPGPQQSTLMSISPNLRETCNNLSPMAWGQALFCKLQLHITHRVYASPGSQESPAGLCLRHSAGSPSAARLLKALTTPGYPWDNQRDNKADVCPQWMLQTLAERGGLLPAPLLTAR